jgi:hypothetical protein
MFGRLDWVLPKSLPTRILYVFVPYSVNNTRAIVDRSQWSCGLIHELFLPAQTLGSWFRIPLEAWMSVCVCFYSVYVVLCVGSAATG